MAGVAAAFTLGNAPATSATAADALGPQTTAATGAASTATVLHTGVPAKLQMSIGGQPATGPSIRLDAAQVAAMTPKGKHHRTASAKYVVRDGDTLASIAQRLYHSSDYWTVLYWANHHAIKYANEIEAGQVLTVPAKPARIPSAPASLAPAAVPTAAAPTSTASYSSASTASSAPTQSSYSGDSGSLQACIIAAESGGDAQIWNASGHYGLYQFSESTWAEYGGDPAEFGDATVAEQNQVFDNAIAAGGASNWSLYDGC
jgi:LysM repeat protein